MPDGAEQQRLQHVRGVRKATRPPNKNDDIRRTRHLRALSQKGTFAVPLKRRDRVRHGSGSPVTQPAPQQPQPHDHVSRQPTADKVHTSNKAHTHGLAPPARHPQSRGRIEMNTEMAKAVGTRHAHVRPASRPALEQPAYRGKKTQARGCGRTYGRLRLKSSCPSLDG